MVLYHEPTAPEKSSNEKSGKRQKSKRRGKGPRTLTTRRVVGEVVDFGVDSDNELKLIVSLVSSKTVPLRLEVCGLQGPFTQVALK